MDIYLVIIAALALLAGGVLKGATGAGAPIIVIPVLSVLVDVRFAVIVFAYPNLFANIFQVIKYRAALGRKQLWLPFALGGFAGAFIGSLLLVRLNADTLMLVLALIIVGYIVFRLLHPTWVLSPAAGERLAGAVGLVGGIVYGMTSLSAPITITFVNSMKPAREVFVATTSIFFLSMGLSQMPVLWTSGLLSGEMHLLGICATLAMLAGMPIGERIARHMNAQTFDRAILILLGLIAAKILFDLITS